MSRRTVISPTPWDEDTAARATPPVFDPPPNRAGSALLIDLDAVQSNWRAIGARLGGGAGVGAVVKADAYGLGAAAVGQALANAGCRRFFVATPDEGIALREALPRVEIYVLDGLIRGAAADYAQHRLTPCLLDPGQVEAWVAAGRRAVRALPAALHIDSGMGRSGMSP
ncbi:MAG: alanine racemase, partial [Pseudomonadota bacterium]